MRAKFHLVVFGISAVGFASPAVAFDCAKATTPVELAICADPALKAADNSMAAAYNSLRNRLDKERQDALLQTQRRFILRREACADQSDDRDACILQDTDKQRMRLAGSPMSGDGTSPTMISDFTGQLGGARSYAIEILSVVFANPKLPGERAFNSAVGDLIKDAPWKKRPDGPFPDAFARTVEMDLTYASPEFVSAIANIYSSEGGAHPVTWSRGLNYFTNRSRAAQFDDFFTARAKSDLVQMCGRQIIDEKTVRFGEGEPAGTLSAEQQATISKTINDLSKWSFMNDGATIIFDVYEIGAYVEGPYACKFSRASLRPYMFPNAPLWR